MNLLSMFKCWLVQHKAKVNSLLLSYTFKRRIVLLILVGVIQLILLYFGFQFNQIIDSDVGDGSDALWYKQSLGGLHHHGETTDNVPLLFIGGMPRSGTTLTRVLLDAHPQIRCGPETHILPKLLISLKQIYEDPFNMIRMEKAGITRDVIDRALRRFILDIIKHQEKKGRTQQYNISSPHLFCNKDPLLLLNGMYLHRLFPRLKYIYMVRDGRAVAHSIVTRKILIGALNITDFESCLRRWNAVNEIMTDVCKQMGKSSCLRVHYEKLVLAPKRWLETILRFIGLPWNSTMLQHHKLIANGEIKLNLLERSTDQVVKPITTEALTKWVGHVPANLLGNMSLIAPMLEKLGYDPNANPPNYGLVDPFVDANMHAVQQEQTKWNQIVQDIETKRTRLRNRISALKSKANM